MPQPHTGLYPGTALYPGKEKTIEVFRSKEDKEYKDPLKGNVEYQK